MTNLSILALSYSGNQVAEPFEPVDDDQLLVNDVTVSQPDGSSARATLDVGALSTAAAPAGVGRYDVAVTANAFSDDGLPGIASWLVHRGTWDEARYPSVSVNLAHDQGLQGSATAADLGCALGITGLPAWLPPGDVSLIVEGYTETIGHPNDWTITYNTTPAGPYRVLQADSQVYGRLDSLQSTAGGAFSSSATSILVVIAAGSATWITTATRPGDFPFDVVCGGERMTVTGIVDSGSQLQTFTVTRGVNGFSRAIASGDQIRLAAPLAVAL